VAELRLPRINRVLLAGRVVRDFVLRYTTDEVPVARFTLAFNRRVLTGDDSWTDVPGFVDVLVANRLAEQCAERLKKGSPVYLEGRMQMRKTTDKDGVSRLSLEIKADTVQFLDRRTVPAAEPAERADTPPPTRPVEGDLPF
jgi:single-strand DNA-binding protein